MNKSILFVFCLMLCFGLLSSCDNTAPSAVAVEKDLCTFPGDYEIDNVSDIQTYFDSLCTYCGACCFTRFPEYGEDSIVFAAIKELDRYVKHERKYYPENEIRDAVARMVGAEAYAFNHCVGVDSNDYDLNLYDAFMFRFMEQAVVHSPQIDFVTDFHSSDGKAGIWYFHEWCPYDPLYSFLVYATDDGLRMLTIGSDNDTKKGDVKITAIYNLTDEQGRTYYLCSNKDNDVYFRQYLYGWDGHTMTLLCHENGRVFNSDGLWDPGDYTITFNPRTLQWDHCLEKNGVYQRIEGSPSCRLILDWDKSHFETL